MFYHLLGAAMHGDVRQDHYVSWRVEYPTPICFQNEAWLVIYRTVAGSNNRRFHNPLSSPDVSESLTVINFSSGIMRRSISSPLHLGVVTSFAPG